MMLLALLLAAQSPLAQPAETPKAWMERVYAEYRTADFSPFKHPEHYFAPTLLAAINQDNRLAHGEVGYLDGDPICQCQDAGGMRASVVGVTRQGGDKASVKVSLHWPNDPARPVTYSLVRTKNGWRITDVSLADEPSLLAALEKSNREAKRR